MNNYWIKIIRTNALVQKIIDCKEIFSNISS